MSNPKCTNPKWDALKKSLNGYSALITIWKDKNGDRYEESMAIVQMDPKTICALGYIPCNGYLKGSEFMFMKAYIKFNNFGVVDPRKLERPSLETSGTLYDYLASDSQEAFLKGMKNTNRIGTLDMKKLGFYGVVAIGVIFGSLILMGGI